MAHLIVKKNVFFVVFLVLFSLFFNINAFAQYSVTSLYGGNISSNDVIGFANSMNNLSGWSIDVVDTTGIVKQLKDADNQSTFAYWSGHGTTTGKFSCYGINSQTGYINYSSSNAPILHEHIGSCSPFKYPGMPGYMSDSCWNSSLKYVLFAACNQIGTNSNLTQRWANTMYGNYNRVNMIFGYAGTAPGDWISSENDYRDNLIANKFVSNMSAGYNLRNAWYNANTTYGISHSSVLYNPSASNDTITSMSTLNWNNDPYPTIYIQQSDRGLSSAVNQQPNYESLNSTGNFKKYTVNEVDNIELFDIQNFEDFEICKDAKDLNLLADQVTNYISKRGYLPNDAEFDCIDVRESTVIQTCKKDSSDKKLTNYVVRYRQKYDDKKISQLYNGSYLEVYIEEGKIEGVVKKWLIIDSASKSTFNTKSLINNKEAIVKKANESLMNSNYCEVPQLKSVEIVYCQNSNKELVPVWEVSYDGIIVQIDCITGEIF